MLINNIKMATKILILMKNNNTKKNTSLFLVKIGDGNSIATRKMIMKNINFIANEGIVT